MESLRQTKSSGRRAYRVQRCESVRRELSCRLTAKAVPDSLRRMCEGEEKNRYLVVLKDPGGKISKAKVNEVSQNA
jgi:hypothetical protein